MAFLDEALTERITVQAREIRFWRTVAMVLAGLLWGLGFLTAKAFGLLWFAAAWSATALRVGWAEGRKTAGRPRR
jgi:high-affinity nickel permease